MKASRHIILPTLTFICCPPADRSKMTIILSASVLPRARVYVCVCACVFVRVYARRLCMRQQPRTIHHGVFL